MKTLMSQILVAGSLMVWAAQAAVIVGPNATLTFEPGRAQLTQESENRLKDLVRQAKQLGKIDEVKIAAWSDNPTPRENEELSKADRELAENRLVAVANCLKKYKVIDVEAYNMAEKANWLARTLHTETAEMKAEMARPNDIPMFKEEYQVFKNNGDASKAVVVALVKFRT
ncbi:MAG: hypothetical protein HYR96_07480 [Deltaproteobacteria bacterium]|nr:hypothetical protein [Deltaproteobacteria bacterium]